MESSSEKMEKPQLDSSKKGGLRTMPFIIANEAFEKVASYGLQANMILYLLYEYHMDIATGTSVLFLWSATSNFLPIIGAFLSDSFLGRFRVISLGTIASFFGMSLLWLTAAIPQATPPKCNIFRQKCEPPKPSHLALLYSAFILMSIGAGGIRPCSLAFGADQFNNPNNPKNERTLQSFFNWYYASVGVSAMIAVTVIVYIQDVRGWVVGFGVPVGLMFLSTVLFLVGSSLYVKVQPNKSLFTGLAQVMAVAWKNRRLALPPRNSDGWYYHHGSEISAPTETLRFLNKACVIRNPDKDLNSDGSAAEPWNLCTVKRVEELKALIKVLPIWSTGIIIAVTISQHSFPVIQAQSMDRHFTSNFKIPAASFGVFTILSLTIWVTIYDSIIVPFLAKFTKHPRGLGFKQRMGIGLVLSCLAMGVSAIVERNRRFAAIRQGLGNNPGGVVNMSAMWLVPQHCLIGLAEAFNAIGQIEFYYSQFPKSMSSIGIALVAMGMAVGNLVGSLIVVIVDDLSKKWGNVSWVSGNLNKGHYDYYYWVLAILCGMNFFYFILCSWKFGCDKIRVWEEDEGHKDEDIPMSKGSPLAFSI